MKNHQTGFRSINHYASDIRVWIAILFLIRLIGITNPPLETGHNWRQSLTNMVARNFHEDGLDLLHPTVDFGGHRSGIIGSEFPIYNALIATTANVFGYEHWYGRLINLIVSSIGLYFFFLLVQFIVSKQAALYGTIVLGVSIWFAFSRKIMPDTFSVSIMIFGTYFGARYLINGGYKNYLPFLVFTALGMLCKIPNVYLLSLLGVVVFLPSVFVSRKVILCCLGLSSFVIASIWYFYWVPHLVDTYKFQLFFTKGFIEGWLEIRPHFGLFMEKFYFSSLHSFIGFAMFLMGVYFIIKQRKQFILFAFLITSSVFFLFALKTGEVFPLHNYYIIPFVPVIALISGIGISRFPSKIAVPILILIAVEAIANQNHDFFLSDESKPKLALEFKVKKHLPNKAAKVIINGGDSPTDLYFAHRKGWTCFNEQLIQPGFLDSLYLLGAQYLIIQHSENTPTFKEYPVLYEDDICTFYEINDKHDQ